MGADMAPTFTLADPAVYAAFVPEAPSPAEELLDLARLLLLDRERIMGVSCFSFVEAERFIARTKLALDFQRLGAAAHFRAIFERWDHQRILLETY